MKKLFEQFVKSAKGTFLEKDRNSNFPSESTILNSTLCPVLAIERQPTPEDCDEVGQCWWFAAATDAQWSRWVLSRGTGQEQYWLPAQALPLPQYFYTLLFLMTDNNHPITPPLELLKYWKEQYLDAGKSYHVMLIEAFQAGADQELEACREWLKGQRWEALAIHLRSARRPEPPSIKEQALEALEKWAEDEYGPGAVFHKGLEVGLIRRALKALPD